MVIRAKTRMLLFRYNNYKKNSFIDVHKRVIKQAGFVWMMKIGKRTNIDKINDILSDGGLLVLRSPLRDGGGFYLCKFTDVKEILPEQGANVPDYYTEILNDEEFYGRDRQFFKVEWIVPLPEVCANKLVLQLNGKNVNDTIKQTRTAIMFVVNESEIEIDERE